MQGRVGFDAGDEVAPVGGHRTPAGPPAGSDRVAAAGAGRTGGGRRGRGLTGYVSNARIRTEMTQARLSLQVFAFELETRDDAGRPIGRTAVELRGEALNGPLPVDGAPVRVYGRHCADGILRARRVVQLNLRDAVLTAGIRRPARYLRWAFGTVVTLFLVTVFVLVAIGFVRFVDAYREVDIPGRGPQQTLRVPDVAGMTPPEAMAALERAGFAPLDYRVVHKRDGKVRFGDVIATDPPAGSPFTPDRGKSRVHLLVSIGSR
ncbi:PASTA domain-containing protein [Plantactinospora sp. CA-290183]|uniref:PASTA domain-containing protein n=1 Tax=Plantactinospora sp. CA-290183 TaxID=3240006 RepID=UPI003D94EC1C